MRALRLILAGLIAVAVLVAGFFAAAVIILTGMAGYVIQLFRRRPDPAPSGARRAPGGQPTRRMDDAIDVVATKVTDDPTEH